MNYPVRQTGQQHIRAQAPQADYLLLTPGPLTTTATVKEAMLYDSCTWDADYNQGVVQPIRHTLTALAAAQDPARFTSVLLQGSGSYVVESVLGSAIGAQDCVLIICNGAYGERMGEIAAVLGLAYYLYRCGETELPDLAQIEQLLRCHNEITHVAMVHCETTTGMLNPLSEVAALCRQHKLTLIVDAMSSFGGISLDMAQLGIHFLISSANKCLQGVPGFGFVIAEREALQRCRGQARSLALDLYAQWHTMETQHGKWRFTSPTHTVLALAQALHELMLEGGIAARYQRYCRNQQLLVQGMQTLGFTPLLPAALHSPVITAFYSPSIPEYSFADFYQALKAQGFVIYPGKVSQADCFRIGTIGDVHEADIRGLLQAMARAVPALMPVVQDATI
ncbi:2-aminoethylphosphonate--pyruvate transaminase [Plesiomonas shigelloides]|uniref:2-aminoethylphosphonate--pyruvate transaminase n=1 Tax=Plesiomonas shigelloides TaxID=703 RepID=UPI001E51C322|nr:2-aminoethylphosphonate--pyruvate transaminase [Plesiomonas shigelloides]